MLLRQLEDKELISLQDGRRIGYFGDADLVFNADTGQIVGLEISNRSRLLQLFAEKYVSVIPWDAIKKIGKEVIILDVSTEADIDSFRDL